MQFYQQAPAGVGLFDGTWNPSQLPGLVGWYDAMDAAGYTLSGGSLQTWKDKSGARNLSVGGGAPTYNGSGLYSVGKPAMVWPDGSNSVDMRHAVATTMQHIAIVAGYTSGATNFRGFEGLVSREQAGVGTEYIDGSGSLNTFVYSGLSQLAINGAAEVALSSNPVILPLTPSILIARNAGAALNINNLYLGSDRGNGGRGWSGPISEVVITSSAMSAADQAKLEGYLAWKWGLQDKLPAPHAYKQFPPS